MIMSGGEIETFKISWSIKVIGSYRRVWRDDWYREKIQKILNRTDEDKIKSHI